MKKLILQILKNKKKNIINNEYFNCYYLNNYYSHTSDNNILIKSKELKNLSVNKPNHTVHRSGYTREWYNSIYSYDKNYIKNLVYKDNLVKFLFKSYFNIRILKNEYKDALKIKRVKNTRFSNDKLLLSKSQIKHTNNKVIFTIFILNNNNRKYLKILKSSIKKFFLKNIKNLFKEFNFLRKKLITKKIINDKLFNNFSYFKLKRLMTNNNYKLDNSFNKSYKYTKLYNKFINKKNAQIKYFSKLLYSLINLHVLSCYKIKPLYLCPPKFKHILLNPFYSKTKVMSYNFIYKKRFYYTFQKLISLLYLNQIVTFNKYKFINLFLNYKGFGLISILSKIYKKKIEFNIVNLKSVQLNSDIFSESIAVKLSNRKNKVLKVIKKALRMVRLPSWILYFMDDSRNLKSSMATHESSPSNRPGLLHEASSASSNYENKDNILHSIRYKNVSGIRFETSGRLTRRLTASRSVYKARHKGSLKNIYSSYKGISSVLLRGYAKPNLQYTLVNSTSRNGSFGLKGWISSY
uniref:hypothetical protein n=1 Tax=Gonatophragmium mori TaxID=2966219 RepID=UPI0023D80A45|nr:hypothetical protein P2Z26_mgp40 [Gonatophragmium mori]WCZ71140.1 hypothetical protein [Gonatophragmium mori]